MAEEIQGINDNADKIYEEALFYKNLGRFFLAHTPPGYDVGDVEEACIAHVHWYKKVPRRDQIDPAVGCPVFQEGFKDDPNGNMWPMEKLAPVTLTVARHRKSGHLTCHLA
ncbi:TPA: hypothetical protein ACH3X1_004958 [Trebouxia sp. C0004]